MSGAQPEALRLAEMLAMGEDCAAACRSLAAAELRRLHALNAELVEALELVRKRPSDPNKWLYEVSAALAKAKARP